VLSVMDAGPSGDSGAMNNGVPKNQPGLETIQFSDVYHPFSRLSVDANPREDLKPTG
jgi:hypothetical protein